MQPAVAGLFHAAPERVALSWGNPLVLWIAAEFAQHDAFDLRGKCNYPQLRWSGAWFAFYGAADVGQGKGTDGGTNGVIADCADRNQHRQGEELQPRHSEKRAQQ